MTSEWVPEAQRIAKEAAEKARGAVLEHVNVAMGLLIQNAPTAAQALLEALVLETDIPRPERLRALSLGDWARASERGNAIALNERLSEARDAALEEAAQVIGEYREALRGATERGMLLAAMNEVRALKGRK